MSATELALAAPGKVFPRLARWLGRDDVLVALSVISGILMGFNGSVLPVTRGLDPSYVYAFNYASAHHEQWGRDFVSTYGPFGHVIWAMDVGSHVWGKLLSNLLLAAGFGVAAAVYLRGARGLGAGTRLAAMGTLVYAFSIQDPEYRWFALFVLVLLIGLLAERRAGLAAFAVAGLLGGFYLLVKFSLGVSAAVTLLLASCLVRHPRAAASRLAVSAAALAAGLLSGWVSAGGTPAGIASYLVTGLEMARGYSSAMSYRTGKWWAGVAALLAWFALLGLWGLLRPRSRKTIVLAGLAFPLFAAWKHAIVRQDDVHVEILVRFGIFVIAVLLIETAPVWGWRRALPAAGVLLLPLAVAWMSAIGVGSRLDPGEMGWSPSSFRGLKSLGRLVRVDTYRGNIERMSRAELQGSVLPASLRQRIGRNPVDVYPWETSYVPANQLSWVHRPIPASFNAYSPALDGLNAAFFRSDRRPGFLIWHAGFRPGMLSIDQRHLLWDEPETLRAIVDHYDIAGATPEVLLLRARASARYEAPQPLVSVQVSWDTPTPVPDADGVILFAPSIGHSLALGLLQTVFRGQPVMLRVWFDSGKDAVFRLVSDNRGGPLWLSPLATTLEELPGLLEDGIGHRVTAISFHGTRLIEALAPPISVTWFRMAPHRAS
jgi:hypothetical protein